MHSCRAYGNNVYQNSPILLTISIGSEYLAISEETLFSIDSFSITALRICFSLLAGITTLPPYRKIISYKDQFVILFHPYPAMLLRKPDPSHHQYHILCVYLPKTYMGDDHENTTILSSFHAEQ